MISANRLAFHFKNIHLLYVIFRRYLPIHFWVTIYVKLSDVQIHNILDNKKDRHYVSIESLSVNQLKDELKNRHLSKIGKKV